VVNVGGTPCQVTSSTNEKIECVLDPTASVPTDASFVGQHGIRRTFVNTSHTEPKVHPNTIHDMKQNFPRRETLAMTLTTELNAGDYIGNVFKGWFIPPETTNYRFWQACDDWCNVKFGSAPQTATETTTIIDNNYRWTHWRDYRKVVGDGTKRHSEWLALEKDKPYYIEASHVEWGGGDHMTVAVEIQVPQAK